MIDISGCRLKKARDTRVQLYLLLLLSSLRHPLYRHCLLMLRHSLKGVISNNRVLPYNRILSSHRQQVRGEQRIAYVENRIDDAMTIIVTARVVQAS